MNIYTPITLAALLALTACAPMAGPGMAHFSQADLPTAVQVPAGNSVAMETAMQGVTYIQRVATRGGVAPATACTTATVGQKQVVQYQADYIFWRAGTQSSTASTLPGSA